MNLQQFIKNGILNTFAGLFQEQATASIILTSIGFPPERQTVFPSNGRFLEYWSNICNEIQRGVLPTGDDLQPLVDAAAALFPSNPILSQYRSYRSESLRGDDNDKPQHLSASESENEKTNKNDLLAILVTGRDDRENIVEIAKTVAKKLSMAPESISLTSDFTDFNRDENVLITLNNWNNESANSLCRILRIALQSSSNPVSVTILFNEPQPYLISRLFIQVPDQSRFVVENISSDTYVREITQGVMIEEYNSEMLNDSTVKTQQAIAVVKINEDGSTERLKEDQTLLEANIQEGDTLDIVPEIVFPETASDTRPLNVTVVTKDPQPYLINRIFVEAPDQSRFAIEDVSSDTKVRKIAQAIITEYSPEISQDKIGRKLGFIVDKINKDGSKERLKWDETLHEANIQYDDTLSVAPEATAGCFPGHTVVTLADDQEKPIQDIKVGDSLLSYNPETSQYQPAIVSEVYQGWSDEQYILDSNLEVTASHLIFANEDWIPVGQLKIGDKLKNKFGQEFILTNITKKNRNIKVYNLHLDSKEHTFFAQGILVHNMLQKNEAEAVSSELSVGRKDSFAYLDKVVNSSLILVQGWQTVASLIEQVHSIAREQGKSPDSVNLELVNAKGVLLRLTDWATEQVVPLASRLESETKNKKTIYTSIFSSKLQERVLDYLLIEGFKMADSEISNFETSKKLKDVAQSGNSIAQLENEEINSSKNGESKETVESDNISFKKIERYTKIYFPSECIIGQEVELKIQLTLKVPSKTKILKSVSLTVEDNLEEVQLNVHITSSGFKSQQHYQSILLPSDRDSEEITFILVPIALDEQIIEIEFFYKASRVGYVLVKSNVKQLKPQEVNS